MKKVNEGLIMESSHGEVCVGNYCKINEIIVDVLSSFSIANKGIK